MNVMAVLKEAKKLRRMTAEDIAEKTSIPVSTLNKIFSGVIDEPKFSAVVAIAHALDCPITSLTESDPALGLPAEEKVLLLSYRSLDKHGKEICDFIINKEAKRCSAHLEFTPMESESKAQAVIPVSVLQEKIKRKVKIRLFDLPASAGCGEPLDASTSTFINVPESAATLSADFAVRVNGSSMEPEYHTGDVILISNQRNILAGELGLFVADGEGYFKKFGGDRLISLNPKYSDIPISSFSDFSCCGKVIGRLRRKN